MAIWQSDWGTYIQRNPLGPEDVNGAKDQFITESLYAHLLCLSVAAKSDGFHGQVVNTLKTEIGFMNNLNNHE